MLSKLFALRGTYPPYEIFSSQHYMLIVISVIFICALLYQSRSMEEGDVIKSVRRCVWIMCALEAVKILFNLTISKQAHFLPLYYCSIPLFAGWFSAYCKGPIKRLGDVFLLVGGLVGGISYFVSPITTAGKYHMFHFITMQSYLHHSLMIYISLLFIMTDYIKLKKTDLLYYAIPVILFSVVAYLVNGQMGTNYMFISRNRPGTPIEIVYNASPRLFPVMITFWQTLPPFIVVKIITYGYKHIRDYISAHKTFEQKI